MKQCIKLPAELYVDFEESMGKGTGYFRAISKLKDRPLKTYHTFKTWYDKYNFLKVTPTTEAKIPKIIHQIWIGDRPMTKLGQEYQTSWFNHHPDWEYTLWDNEKLNEYRFADPNLEYLFRERAGSIGEKVDILRYDILYQFGGLYVDVDCQCLHPLDFLHHVYDFYAGLIIPVPESLVKDNITVCNSVIGAKPGHPVLKKLGELLAARWDKVDDPKDKIRATIQRTYSVLTDALMEAGGQPGNTDIVLPPTYFQPILDFKLLDLAIRGIGEPLLERLSGKAAPFSKIQPQSLVFHNSQREWFVDSYEAVTFKSKIWLAFKAKDWINLINAKLNMKKSVNH